ncbi:Maf-like protein [Aureimonas sp. AU22]|uniref:Maf-like protein n=1 Tax=Aureimonas sp. AU22 TaxID=1638162 RepID=UPI000780776F|nr:Maf-like protein [Aureimonas sp. AU22]
MGGLVLASGSRHRQALLAAAGIDAQSDPSTLDERLVEAPLKETGATPDEVALVLAEAKAVDVSERRPGMLVIGADQVLSVDDEILHKPADMEAARRTLLKLSGRTHHLDSAVVLARDGEAVWRHVSRASITFRTLTPAEIGRYLAAAGDAVLTSVGAYQVEGRGLQLMERIEGDLFTVIGLPMLPLIAELRARGALDD